MASKPDPVDVHVGQKLRERRTFMGMTQEQLGAALGITFQQVQKYERGTNRIGASRLFRVCRSLDVSPEYFFDGYGATSPAHKMRDPDGATDREAMELLRAYRRVDDPALRHRLLDLAKAMARADVA